MGVLVVYESLYGNTAAIAAAVARGVRDAGVSVIVAEVAEAPDVLPDDVTLLVVGAPTHNRGLPTEASRTSVAGVASSPSLRSWLTGRSLPASIRVAAFDTAIGGFWAGSAAKAIGKLVRRGGRVKEMAERSFVVVRGDGGPRLRDGELAAAHAWGRLLAG